jgi:predicted metal-dependent HD superfamily phosphohydrolase
MDVGAKAMGSNDAVEMALWYHDAIYDLSSTDNEYRSAELFKERAGIIVPDDFRDSVCRLICVTTHNNLPVADDEKFIVDVDLSSFGMPWRAFNSDSARVRREFAHLTDEQFVARQRRFLQSLLDRESVYATDFYRERYEAVAQANIARQLAALKEAR